MIGDRDLLAFRQGYYDLLVSLFWKEPAGELLSGLAEGMEERITGSRNLHPLMGEGWAEIGRFLGRTARERLADTVAEEYARLFIGPPHPAVYLYESYYLARRLLDRPLTAVRNFLREIGMEKQPGYSEPEDFLAFELEIMRRLIARQRSASNPDDEVREVNSQATFLKRHLLVWGPAAAKDLSEAQEASFYRGAANVLHGFLSLERDLFKGWGPEEVISLEVARQSIAGKPEWRGPLFDLGDRSEPTIT